MVVSRDAGSTAEKPKRLKVWFEVGHKPPKRMTTTIKVAGKLKTLGRWTMAGRNHTLEHDEHCAKDVYSSRNPLEVDLNDLDCEGGDYILEYRYFVWDEESSALLQEEDINVPRKIKLNRSHIGKDVLVKDFMFNDLSRKCRMSLVEKKNDPYEHLFDDEYNDYDIDD